jgi:hypothetical protein
MHAAKVGRQHDKSGIIEPRHQGDRPSARPTRDEEPGSCHDGRRSWRRAQPHMSRKFQSATAASGATSLRTASTRFLASFIVVRSRRAARTARAGRPPGCSFRIAPVTVYVPLLSAAFGVNTEDRKEMIMRGHRFWGTVMLAAHPVHRRRSWTSKSAPRGHALQIATGASPSRPEALTTHARHFLGTLICSQGGSPGALGSVDVICCG